jgi:hypothetical protein
MLHVRNYMTDLDDIWYTAGGYTLKAAREISFGPASVQQNTHIKIKL